MRLSPRDWVLWGAMLLGIALALLGLRGSQVTLHAVDAETGTPLTDVEFRSGDIAFPTDESGNSILWLQHKGYSFEASLAGYESTDFYFDPGTPSCWFHCPMTVTLRPTRATFRVRDARTGRVVPKAKVSIDGKPIESVANGGFCATRVPMGKHLVSIRASRYFPFSATLDIESTDAVYRFDLEPTRLCVDVRGLGGDPLSGAHVLVADEPVSTKPDGTACFSYLPSKVQATVAYTGYLTTTFEVDGLTNRIVRVSLRPRTVETRLWDPWKQRPVPGATVVAAGKTVRSDEDGRVTLTAVPESGEAVISAQGFVSTTVPLAHVPSTVTLKADGIRLWLVDAFTGEPVPHAVLKHHPCSWRGDDEGRVLLPKGMIGNSAVASAPGYRVSTIPVTATETITHAMTPASLSGVVRDASTGRPIRGVRFYLPSGKVMLSEDGSFSLDELPPDVKVLASGYRVLDFSHPYADAFRPPVDACDSPPCADIVLKPFKVRAIYIPYGLLTRPKLVRELMKMIEDSPTLNAVVVDAKGDHGYLAWASKVPEAAEFHARGSAVVRSTFSWLLKEARAKGIYVVARFVTFKDNPLATHKADWAVKTKDDQVWLDREGLGWANPYLDDVQKYEVALVKELAATGVDEIQLDYLRFPSDGDLSSVKYDKPHTRGDRTKALREFVEKVRKAIWPRPVFLSADTFGLTVWVNPREDMNIGQRVRDIAPYIDYLCPMVYPSTFTSGNLGYENPSAHPYDLVFRSVEQAWSIVPPTVKVRPWLQAYWYSHDQMVQQRQAAEAAGAWGWSYWNAGGKYDRTLFFPRPRSPHSPFQWKYRSKLEMKTLQCSKFN